MQCGKTSSFGEVCAPNARSEKEKLALERLALEKSKQQNTLIMFFCGCGCFLVACFLFQSLLGKGIDWADRTSEKLIAAVENTACASNLPVLFGTEAHWRLPQVPKRLPVTQRQTRTPTEAAR